MFGRHLMCIRLVAWLRYCLACALWLAIASLCHPVRADIFRWDNGQVIPGTEGITPGPGIELDHRDLEFASLQSENLSGISFEASNLTNANLSRSTLTIANLGQANLTSANLTGSTLVNAQLRGTSFTHAIVTRTDFSHAFGFTKEQLYSTASYQQKDLVGVGLAGLDLSQANLAGQDLMGAVLSGAYLGRSTLANANLTGANLSNTNLSSSTLTNADLMGAVVTGASFGDGFTQQQLSSTQSYQDKNLTGIGLWGNDLIAWDLSGQNLTSASLVFSTLTGADLTGAVVTGTHFGSLTGFTKAQLESTASYEAKNLEGIRLSGMDLTGWDFSGQNLTGASFFSYDGLVGNPDFFSRLTDTVFTGAVVNRANFHQGTHHGFTQAQLKSTASYQAKDLQGIDLSSNNLIGWDFSGQNLSSAQLNSSRLENANLAGANLTNANLHYSTLNNANLTGAIVRGTILGGATSRGFTKDQLYSTDSYQQKNLEGVDLSYNDLTGGDFSGQNLTGALLAFSTLTGADMTGANLFMAELSGANLSEARLTGTNLAFAWLDSSVLTGADLTGANLANAHVEGANFSQANLTAADLRGSIGGNTDGAITRNTILPNGTIEGLNLPDGEELVVRGYGKQVKVDGNLTVSDGGRLEFRILLNRGLDFGASLSSTISCEPNIPVHLGGTLALTFNEGVVPGSGASGLTFDLFDWTGVEPTGAFTVASPYLWDISNLYTTGEVRLTGTGGVGDYDQSGAIDQVDLDLVLLNWGIKHFENGLPAPVGWTNDLPSGLVDQNELDKVLLNWGSISPVVGVAGVPEPSGMVLALFALTVGLLISSRPTCRR